MSKELGLGKVSKGAFERLVAPHLPLESPPQLDGGRIWVEGETIVAHSPSIGLPLQALGFFALHYAATNVACRFGVPRWLVAGIYLPLGSREEELETIAKQLGAEAKRYGVKVVAGQTATYYGLQIPLLTATCLGPPISKPPPPTPGDQVALAGLLGGEALWLKTLAGEAQAEVDWRRLTPLPAALALNSLEEVRLLHDVSEGGLKGALLELAQGLGCGLELSTENLKYHPGAEGLGEDLLKAPTYGTLLVVAQRGALPRIEETLKPLGLPLAPLGSLVEGQGVTLDGEEISEAGRGGIDELYGRVT